MTQNRHIFLNIVATYGRSLYALVIGSFCGRRALMGLLMRADGLTAGKMVKYAVSDGGKNGQI